MIVGNEISGTTAVLPINLHSGPAVATGRTGVEMEALTAVSVGCLTVYDMVKAVDRGMVVEGIRLLDKTGGTRGDWHHESQGRGAPGLPPATR